MASQLSLMMSHVRASDYVGKRVVVAGMGNTSADIANDLVGVASKVYLSHSRGAHVVGFALQTH